MKQTHIFIIAVMGILAFSFVKNNEAEKIWTEQSKIDKVIAYEKGLSKKSEFLKINSSLSKSVYPLLDQYKMANPIIVKRKQTGFLPLYAEYYYSASDSILRYVSYDWERDKFGNFFDKQKIWDEEKTKLKEYNKEYERIKTQLETQIGKPTTEDKEPQITKSTAGRGDYLSREANWETDEYHAEVGMIFESMTYRIRMTYYWKK